ncbi:MAG: PAS domain S-box protein [Gemmatimonadaceae bacterium]
MSTNRPARDLRETNTRFVSEPLYADAFENAPHAMALIASNGEILQANRALRRMLGYRKDEVRSLKVSDITHPDDLATDLQQRRRLASADIGRYELVQRYLRKDRVPIWVRLSTSASRGTASDPAYFVTQVEPVASQTPLQNGDGADGWLPRVGDAMLSAIHEIGNCLTPLMLNTEMIVEQSPRGEICESAQEIFKAARRIAFTLRRLRRVEDARPVAYLGQSRMLDLRMVAPPSEKRSEESDAAGAA